MHHPSLEEPGLAREIGAVYRGPLEEFIGRRDALAKALRSSKRREDANRVKALRKPTRTAWILDQVVFAEPAVIEQLAAAITAAQDAPSRGSAALRAALEHVRTAVRAVATAGARESIRAGHPLDANSLVSAVHSVIGDAAAFAELRAGRLVDIPEGGGLDILTAIALAGSAPTAVVAARAQAAPVTEPQSAEDDAAQAAAAARAALQRAEASLAETRERARGAERTLRAAQVKLDVAEQQLARAQQEAAARRAELERAAQDSATAAGQLQEAERAVADARTRLDR